MSISFRPGGAEPQPMLPGMVVSNEPGYYEDGQYGIRIENVVLCVEADTPHCFGHGGDPYLGFEPLTMVPLCAALIDERLLRADELAWVNDYHHRVRARMLPLLGRDSACASADTGAEDELALRWMMRETEEIRGVHDADVNSLAWRRAQWTLRDAAGQYSHTLPAELNEHACFELAHTGKAILHASGPARDRKRARGA